MGEIDTAVGPRYTFMEKSDVDFYQVNDLSEERYCLG